MTRNYLDASRSLFLAAIVMISIVSGAIAFTGGVGATMNDQSTSPPGVAVNNSHYNGTVTVTAAASNNTTAIQLWLENTSGHNAYYNGSSNGDYILGNVSKSSLTNQGGNFTYTGSVSNSSAPTGTYYVGAIQQNTSLSPSDGPGAVNTSTTIKIDNAKPNATITNPTSGSPASVNATGSLSVQYNATDVGPAGFKNATVAIGHNGKSDIINATNTSVSKGTVTFTSSQLSMLSAGAYNLTLTTYDNAGNTNSSTQTDALKLANGNPITVGKKSAEYTSVQAAINAAPNGTTITVANGTYNTGELVVNKSVTLQAAAGAQPTLTYQPSSYTGFPTVQLTANNATISGFHVVRRAASNRGGSQTSYAQGIRVSGKQDSITNNTVTGNLSDSNNAAVMVISGVSAGNGIGKNVTNVTVAGNTVSGFSTGVSAAGDYGGTVGNVTVTNNTVGAHGDGVAVLQVANTGSSVGTVTFSGNTIQNTATGIHVYGTENGTVPINGTVTAVGNLLANNTKQFVAHSGGNHTILTGNTFDHIAVTPTDNTTGWGDLQAALNQTSSGSSVGVLGTFNSSVSVTTANVSIAGVAPSAFPNNTVSSATAANPATINSTGTAVSVGSSNVTLANLRLESGDGGTTVYAKNAQNITLFNDTVVTDSAQGVYTKGYASIVNNTFREVGQTPTYAIRIDDGKAPVITGNEFNGEQHGALLSNTVQQAVVQGNTFNGMTLDGLLLVARNGKTNAGVSASNNTFENTPDGIITVEIGSSSVKNVDVHYNSFENVTTGITAINGSNAVIRPSHPINATMNYWGSPQGPAGAGANVTAGVTYDPFLTAPASQVTPGHVQDFGNDVTLQAGKTYAIATPAPLTKGKSLSKFFDSKFNGTVYGWNTKTQQWVPGAQISGDVGALSAFVVTPQQSVTVSLSYANSSQPLSPNSKQVSTGWNLVGAPQYGNPYNAFTASSASPARVLKLYSQPGSQSYGQGSTGIWHVDGSTTSVQVSPYTGYWVYMRQNGTVAANAGAGVTASQMPRLVGA